MGWGSGFRAFDKGDSTRGRAFPALSLGVAGAVCTNDCARWRGEEFSSGLFFGKLGGRGWPRLSGVVGALFTKDCAREIDVGEEGAVGFSLGEPDASFADSESTPKFMAEEAVRGETGGFSLNSAGGNDIIRAWSPFEAGIIGIARRFLGDDGDGDESERAPNVGIT